MGRDKREAEGPERAEREDGEERDAMGEAAAPQIGREKRGGGDEQETGQAVEIGAGEEGEETEAERAGPENARAGQAFPGRV